MVSMYHPDARNYKHISPGPTVLSISKNVFFLIDMMEVIWYIVRGLYQLFHYLGACLVRYSSRIP